MRKLLPLFFAAAAAAQDAPPLDPAKLIEALKAIKDQQAQNSQSARQALLKSAQSAASSGPAAAAAWVEAVRLTQFEGAEKEGAQFRDWKEKEGALFSEKEVQNAAQLYFRWLAITTQRALGTPTKELLPSIVAYGRDLMADAASLESQIEHADKEKDRATQRPGAARNQRAITETDRIKRVHNQILRRPLPGSPPVQALRADEVIRADGWEMTPGEVDGIYGKIVLPELRKTRDPRVLEYWDMKIKMEGDAVKDKPAFDQDKFTRERRGELLWNRALEFNELGLRNRCINELFAVLRAYPQHPQFSGWVEALEKIIAPPSAADTPAPAGTSPAK